MELRLRILLVERDWNGTPLTTAEGEVSTRPYEVVVGRRMGHARDLCLALGIDPDGFRQGEIALDAEVLAQAEMMFPGGRPALNRRRLPAYAGESDLIMGLHEALKQAKTPGATAILAIVERGPDDDTFGDLLEDIAANVNSLVADAAQEPGAAHRGTPNHDRPPHPDLGNDARSERSRHP